MLGALEVEELARRSLEIDDKPEEILPPFYLAAFRGHVSRHPYDTNFIVELAVPGKRGVGGNGYGTATCMEDYCWQDVNLGPDPDRPEGGKNDGLGSFWEYQVHCQGSDHLKGRNERCKRAGIDISAIPPPSLPTAPPSSSQPSSTSFYSSPSPLVTFTRDRPSGSGASSSQLSHVPSQASTFPLLDPRSSRATSIPQSSPLDRLSSRPLPPVTPSSGSTAHRSSSTMRGTVIDLTLDSSPPGPSATRHHTTHGSSSALKKVDPNRSKTTTDIPDRKPVIDKGKFRATTSTWFMDDDDDDDQVTELLPDQVPLALRKTSNKDTPYILSDSEDEAEVTKHAGGTASMSIAKPLTSAKTGSSSSVGSKTSTTGSAGPRVSPAVASSSQARALASLAALKASTGITGSQTSSQCTTAPPARNIPVQTRVSFLKAELKLTKDRYKKIVSTLTPDDRLRLLNRMTELQALIASMGMRPYIPPTTEVMALVPGVLSLARCQGVDVLLPVTSPVNPAAPPITGAGAVSGPSGLNALVKRELSMPGGFPSIRMPSNMNAISGPSSISNLATSVIPTGVLSSATGGSDLAAMIAAAATAAAQAQITTITNPSAVDYEYDGGYEFDRPTGDDLQEFFTSALEDFSEDADVDKALGKLGIPALDARFAEMTINLMPHQVLGVSWMLEKEKDKKFRGGLLCDAMGLGKTVQTIATIVGNMPTDRKVRTTLIVAPLALLSQWKSEIESKTTPGLFTVVIHHGNQRAKSSNQLKQADVILTTYGTLVSEFGKEPKPKKKTKKQEGGSDEEEESDDYVPRKKGPLFKTRFWRVVLDEAHFIRNSKTRAAKAVWELDSIHRWCLTGTLIVNSLDDIFVHLKFLCISPSREWKHFHGHISKIQKRRPKLAMKRAQAILRSCMIRRHKESELNGRRLLELPPKTTEVVELDFTPEEREIYNSVEHRMRVKINHFLKHGTILKHFNCVFSWLIRLRQMTCHPWLLRRNPGDALHPSDWAVSDFELFGEALPDVADNNAEVARAVSLLGQEWVDDVAIKLRERHERMIKSVKLEDDEAERDGECSICLDVMTDETISSCKHSFCRTCINEIFANAPRDVDLTDEETAAGARKCPMCRQVILRDRLFSALAIFDPEKAAAKDEKPRIEELEDSGDAKAELSNKAGKRRAVDDDDFEDVKPDTKKLKSSDDGKGKGRAGEPITVADEEMSVEQVVPSTKMKHLGELLQGYIAEEGIKVIVFSQFVSYLDLCGIYLRRLGVKFADYRGSMKHDAREAVIKEFTSAVVDDESPRVLLISLKCGGVGLNLTSASKVISLDLAWNAATENQAVDRAHRIGQTRPVEVKRLVIRDTVEQRILALQQEKEALSDGAMGEGTGGRLGRLSIGELVRLFGVGAEREGRD